MLWSANFCRSRKPYTPIRHRGVSAFSRRLSVTPLSASNPRFGCFSFRVLCGSSISETNQRLKYFFRMPTIGCAYAVATGRPRLSPLRPPAGQTQPLGVSDDEAKSGVPLNDTTVAAYPATHLHGHPERDQDQTERAYIFGPLNRRS